LLFGICGKVAWCEQLVDERLVLTDAVCEHAAMVAIIVETPLDVDSVACCIRDDWLSAPEWAGLVVCW
jgi:hypothetical protein